MMFSICRVVRPWVLGPSDGGFGGYQAVQRHPGAWAAASEMRKDGLALAV